MSNTVQNRNMSNAIFHRFKQYGPAEQAVLDEMRAAVAARVKPWGPEYNYGRDLSKFYAQWDEARKAARAADRAAGLGDFE